MNKGQNMKKVDVLIIGGGFAGVAAAQELEKKGVSTLLVDKKDYFEVTYATLRNVAAPAVTKDDARKPYQSFLKGAFLQSGVSELTRNQATLDNGSTIDFKMAIIASGTRYPSMPIAKSSSAFNLTDRNNELLQHNQNIQNAENILIIGGGVVGVELAGEITHAFPSKKLVLAHRGEALLDGFKSKTRRVAFQQLTALGVEVEFNTDYQNISGSYIDQRSGKTATADIVFEAVGTLPNSEFLQAQLPHVLNNKGFVKVNNQLEVSGEDNLYALGDVADVGEAKLGYLAQQQGEYLARLISNKLKSKSTKGYKRNPLMALIPTGPKSGVAEMPFAVTTFKPLLNMKQKDLFINKVYSAFES
ncbi:hypothetical protein BCU71_13965 [Vibrio lentus]|nr:hypothetical protein BCU71_13965 [Vibrio lentus]PMK62813.1 hypothetical protein BCT93_14125 [Vibrio lentus]